MCVCVYVCERVSELASGIRGWDVHIPSLPFFGVAIGLAQLAEHKTLAERVTQKPSATFSGSEKRVKPLSRAVRNGLNHFLG